MSVCVCVHENDLEPGVQHRKPYCKPNSAMPTSLHPNAALTLDVQSLQDSTDVARNANEYAGISHHTQVPGVP